MLAALPLLMPSIAEADLGSANGSGSGDSVTVVATSNPVVTVGSGSSGPVCSWDRMFLDREPDEEFTEGDIPVSPTGVGPVVERDINGAPHRLFRRTCENGAVSDRWVRVGVTVGDLIPAVTDRASALLQLPVPDVNPAPEHGGIVNVGLWLAVEPQSVPSVSAQAGPDVWITVSPALVSTRYDFGNGDGVQCDGTGVAIEEVHPDLEVLEESPWCGYTYRQSSPDDDPYRLSVSAVWALPYRSSQGSGSIPSLERTVTVDYDVDEIQTVGVAN